MTAGRMLILSSERAIPYVDEAVRRHIIFQDHIFPVSKAESSDRSMVYDLDLCVTNQATLSPATGRKVLRVSIHA